jgi:hypothetical protein
MAFFGRLVHAGAGAPTPYKALSDEALVESYGPDSDRARARARTDSGVPCRVFMPTASVNAPRAVVA